jgi:hypothetical protein
MTTFREVREEIQRFAANSGIWLEVSGLYDLMPQHPQPAYEGVVARWPERWPNGSYQGVYLWFDADGPEPTLRYVGKSSGRTSCIRMRLNAYFDLAAKRSSGACVLRSEWNGYTRASQVEQRYVVTVAIKPDCESGACLAAEQLEKHLIRRFAPSENTMLKPTDEPTGLA